MKNESAVMDYNDPGQAGDTAIMKYIQSKNIEGVLRDYSGLYYKVIEEGNAGEMVNSNSVAIISYKMVLIPENKEIENSQGIPTSFNNRKLKDHIIGWQIGLRKIGKGGVIWLYIPPYLAFGNVGVDGLVPPNNSLFCELKLIDIK
ncbi:FKBP-type peptidyl-prolyl cis-trans isomerase FkpA [Chitinophaga skermanii]|uniref:Peptidyl-prolyl cis-trans isomerase n=2 Tax=Chitinophaga skermanii TaxID=331697 RepID=A0A327QD92_9BACT|nr:FKBP-type peptidyl-prolyl cis-trans isomerase FkpA [Chitinophaga skermanii]